MKRNEHIEDYYNQMTAKKIKDYIHGNRRVEKAWQKLILWAPVNPEHILEIGCGVGYICARMKKKWPKARVVGIDISSDSVKKAKEIFSSMGIEFIQGNINEVNLKGKFNLIVLMDVYEHIELTKRKNLHNFLNKYLSSKGRIFLSFPTPEFLDYLKRNNPESIQPVDENVTLDDMNILAKDTSSFLFYYRKLSVWRPSDYAHAIVSRPTDIFECNKDYTNFLIIDKSEKNVDNFIIRSKILKAIEETLPNLRGSVLDIGCGRMPYKPLIMANGKITDYIGLDLEMGIYADKQKPELSWNGKKIPIKDNTVDNILAIEVFEHIPNPEIVLSEILRVLTPGGVFFFTIPFIWPLHDIPDDEFRYTPFSFERHLKNTGFLNIDLKPLGGWDAALATMIGLWLKRKPMQEGLRSEFFKQLFPFYNQLLKNDYKSDNFAEQTMFIGICGIANKPEILQTLVINSKNNEKDTLVINSKHIINTNKMTKISDVKSKIAVIQGGFPAISATFILDQITGLIERGFEIENWSTYNPNENVMHPDILKYRLLEKTKYLKFPPEHLKNDIKIWVKKFFVLNEIDNLNDIEAFHIHYGANFNLIEPLFRFYNEKTVIVSFHGYDASRNFKKFGNSCYEYLFKRANLITTPSFKMKNILVMKRCKKEKISVHRCGVDLSKFNRDNTESDSSQLKLLTVARLVEKKGLEFSLKAVASLQNRKIVTYRIIGDGPLRESLLTLAKNLKIEDKIKFLGIKTKDEVIKEMSNADIFLLNSVTARDGDKEGLPVSLIEAQAMGLPVVSTYHAGIPELVIDGETGFLTKEKNVTQITECLNKLISNSQLRKKFSNNAKKRTKLEFNIEKLNDTLKEYFEINKNRNKQYYKKIENIPVVNKNNNIFKNNKKNIFKGIIDKQDNEIKLTDISKRVIKDISEINRMYENLNWEKKLTTFKKYLEFAELRDSSAKTDISIIIICMKYTNNFLKNLDILNRQRRINFRLILVNNGSMDSSFEEVKKHVDVYIKLNKNTGAYLSRNIGALFADSQILLFLDDDGIPESNLIDAHLNTFKKYDVIAVRGVCLPKTENNYNNMAKHYYLGPKPFPVYADIEGNTSYLSEMFFKVGGWDDDIIFGGGGVDLSRRLVNIEPDRRKQIYSPEPIIYHDYAINKYHLINKRKKQEKSFERLRKKHSNLDTFINSWSNFYGREDLIILKDTNKYYFKISEKKEKKTEYLQPKISICIPTYNRENYIKAAVESALNQNYEKYEIIIVDDGSTDNTEEIVYRFNTAKIKFYKNNHQGAPHTRNSCIKVARGDYVLWLDSDDILYPNILKVYDQKLEEYPDADILYCNLQLIDEHQNPKNVYTYHDWYNNHEGMISFLYIGSPIPNPGVLISKKIFTEIGLYNEEYPRAHDFEFWTRVALSKKYKSKHINQILCNYRIHNNNLTGELNENIDYRCELKIFTTLFKENNLKEIFPSLDWNNLKEALFESYYKIAQKFSLLKGYKESISYLEKCAHIYSSPEILKQLALLYFKSGKIDKSQELYSDLVKKYPEYQVIQNNAETIKNFYRQKNHNTSKNNSFTKAQFKPKSLSTKNIPQITGRSTGLSFCVITDGKRPDKLSRLIKSIHEQNFFNYEIIVAGISQPIKDIHYLPMEEAAQSGKIALLRNAAAEKSRYKHLVFVDDDIVLLKGWYAGLKPYTEKYDLISTKFLNLDGTRFWDWSTIGGPKGHVMLDYDEFDEHIYLTGGLLITKANVWESIRWDDRRCINQFEDVDFSWRAKAAGFMFYCCKESVAVHDDPRYTQVGRRVYVRKDAGVQTWLYNKLALFRPAELLDRAARNLKEGLIAETADCIRYCLLVDPNNEVVKNAWQSFVKQIDFPTSNDGRWQHYPILEMNLKIDGIIATSDTEKTSASLSNQIKDVSNESHSTASNNPDFSLPIYPTLAVLWHAPIFDPSGYADEARNFILHLQKQNIMPAVREIGRRSDVFRNGIEKQTRIRLDEAISKNTGRGFISIVQFPAYAFQRVPDAQYHIGRTTFETDGLPADWVQKCNLMDEIWVPSEFNMQTFKAAGVTSKLFKVPEGVDTERFRPCLDVLEIPGTRGVVFLSIFEWIYRKGWDVLLKSWAMAFDPDDDVSLVLRTYPISAADGIGVKKEIELRIDHFLKVELRKSREEVAPIVVLPGQLSEQDMPSLYAAADVYVLPSRGEGWGRTQMEAMACSLPVLSTRWGGNLEFMNDHNSLLIDIEGLVEIDARAEISFYRKQRWAEPSAKHLSALMRKVIENPKEALTIGRRARMDIERYWRWDRIASIAARRLQAIHTALETGKVKKCGPKYQHKVRWEGSQFVHHSLALVNRELCIELVRRQEFELSLIPYEPHQFGAEEDPHRFKLIQEHLRKPLSGSADIHVRHQWPPNFKPPLEGHWVMIQPWEYGALPKDWVEPMRSQVDELWVYSNYVREVYINSGIPASKVFVVPLGVDYENFHSQAKPKTLNTEKTFKFLFVGGTIPRKGIDVLLDAYTSAFNRADDVCLVIKDMGVGTFYRGQSATERIMAIQKDVDAPEILYLKEYLTAKHMAGLYTACDCLVHPYRGEGFGLPVAEAMACGLPVLVTRGGACDDFCNDNNSLLIESQRRPIVMNDSELCDTGWVLEPDQHDLIRHLRFICENKDEGRKIGAVAARQIRELVSWEKSANLVVQRIKELKNKPIIRLQLNDCQKSNDNNNSDLLLYTSIQEQISNGDFEGAIAKLEDLIGNMPDLAIAYNDLGVLYHCQGKNTLALTRYRRAVCLEPGNTNFRKNLADILAVEFGEYEEALQHYVTVLASDPKDVEALLATGHICARLERYDDAADFYERVLEIEPNNSDAQNWLAKMREKSPAKCMEGDLNFHYLALLSEIDQQDLAGAIKKIENFIEMYPKHGQAHNDLGVLYYKNESKTKVLAHYFKAVELEPENVTFRKNLADFLYVEEGRVEEALENYVEVLRIKPDDVETLLITGHICTAIERFEDAMSFYHKVLDIDSQNLDARQNMEALKKRQVLMLHQEARGEKKPDDDAEISQVESHASVDEVPIVQAGVVENLIKKADSLFQRERVDLAVDTLLKAIAVNPLDGRTYIELAGQLVNHGRHENALEVISEMPENQPEALVKKKLLLEGYCQEGIGSYARAKKCGDWVLEREPENAQAMNLNGILAYRNGDKATAEQHFKRAIELTSDYGEPHTNLGALVWETSEPKMALEHYERGFSISPTDIDIANAYHEAVTATGEYKRAEKVARRALKKYPQCRKVLYLLIDTLIRQEKNEEALKELETALATFGIDEGLLDTALVFRERVGKIKKTGSTKKPGVSLCMIVKDEETNLARCLASVKPIVGEMVVVDTGSTDRTRDIAEFFGARVYEFEWGGDFAEARNFSLSKAKGDWILILDADEIISPQDYKRFRKLTAKKPSGLTAYSIITRNYCNMANTIGWIPNTGQYISEETGLGWLSSEKVRLFSNNGEIKFEGAVHELVEPVLKRQAIEMKKCPIPVHHYGRLNTGKLARKNQTYYEIGHNKLLRNGGDIGAVRELAVQATVLEKNSEAIELWQKFLSMGPGEPEVSDAYVNMVSAYIRMQDYDNALRLAQKTVSISPQMKEAQYNLGIAELYNGNPGAAFKTFKKLTQRHPDFPPAQFLLAASNYCRKDTADMNDTIIKLKQSTFGPALTYSFTELAEGLMTANQYKLAFKLLQNAIEDEIISKSILGLYTDCLEKIKESNKVSDMIFEKGDTLSESISECN